MLYLLHIHHRSGHVQTLTFPSVFSRGLQMIALAAQPVTLRVEEVPDVPGVVPVHEKPEVSQ